MNAITPFPEVLIESPARMLGECGTGDQLTDDSHGDLQALSRLAGLVNLTFAAMAGFEGRLLEAPFGDKKILLDPTGRVKTLTTCNPQINAR